MQVCSKDESGKQAECQVLALTACVVPLLSIEEAEVQSEIPLLELHQPGYELPALSHSILVDGCSGSGRYIICQC